jgi:hypothetical protein
MEGAIVSFFTTVVKLTPAGVNRVIASEPIPNGSNDTSILLFTPSTPQLWNLTAQVDAIQTSGAGQLVSMATQNFTVPVGMQTSTNPTPTPTVINNQTSTTTAAVTELMATTITSTQTTTLISSSNPYLQLSTTILLAALVVTLFVLKNSRKKTEDVP